MNSPHSATKDFLTADTDRIAVIENGKQHTFGDVLCETHALLHHIQQWRLGRQERVCLCLNNSVSFICSYFAIVNADLIPVLIDPNTDADRFKYILNDSGAKAYIGNSSLLESIDGCTTSLANVVCDAKPDGIIDSATVDCFDSVRFRGPDDGQTIQPAAANPIHIYRSRTIVYTSGSTGNPKGVVVTGANLNYGTDVIIRTVGLTSQDRTLVTMPYSHMAGLLYMLAHVTTGASIVAASVPIFYGSLLTGVRKNKVTNVTALPAVLTVLVNYFKKELPTCFDSVRFIEMSSAPHNEKLVGDLRELFPEMQFYITYGLTEALRATYGNLATDDDAVMSVGRASARAEITLVAGDTVVTQPGFPGEIHISGPGLAEGYWNRQELTASRFGKRGFKTNDIGYFDSQGRWFIKGRSEDMFSIGEQLIYPTEIENTLLSIPGVIDALVYGKKGATGLELRAKLVTSDPSLNEENMLQYCRKTLDKAKIPAGFEFVTEIATNDAGKKIRP